MQKTLVLQRFMIYTFPCSSASGNFKTFWHHRAGRRGYHLNFLGKVEYNMATKRKAARKKAPARKKAARKAPAKKLATSPITQKMTKSQIVANLADGADLTKKQVGAVLDAYENLISRSISKRGVGEFTMPGLMKITTKKKPATKARRGINPFTGEETMFKAKPASIQVKVRPLKKMKEFAS